MNGKAMQNDDARALLDSLRAIAREGLSYAQNEHDKKRYKKLLDLASGSYASMAGVPTTQVKTLLMKELGSITPKLGIDVAVMNTEGKLLILKRTDNKKWCLPCGWADVEETPFQTAVRETREEADIIVAPIGYIAILQIGPRNYPGFVHQVNICVAAEKVRPDVSITLNGEHSDYKWIDQNDAVDWHPGHERLPETVFRAYEQGLFVKDVS